MPLNNKFKIDLPLTAVFLRFIIFDLTFLFSFDIFSSSYVFKSAHWGFIFETIFIAGYADSTFSAWRYHLVQNLFSASSTVIFYY